MEEEVQVAERGAEQLRAGHAELGVTPHHREVGHQRELERTAERVRLDLRDGDLREGQELVVEAEALAVDAEAPALAGPPLVGSSPYHAYEFAMSAPVLNTPSAAAQDHDLDVVVDRELLEVGRASCDASAGRTRCAAPGCRS